MSYGFIEIIFFSGKFIERFRMETGFKANINGIIYDYRRENDSHRKDITRYAVLDADSRRDTGHKGRVGRRHPSRAKGSFDAKSPF